MPFNKLLFLALGIVLFSASPAAAQLGAIEAFARRVSDLSFYYTVGGLASGEGVLEHTPGTVRAFGVELLFEVAEIRRPTGAPRPAARDTARLQWTGMEVVQSGNGADTTYTYEVNAVPPPPLPTELLWVMEMGLGYGQFTGYELNNPGLDLNVVVRDLPSVTLYASYEPWGNYFGLRTGFMRAQALQVADEEGAVYTGDAEAFLFGGLAGYAFPLEDLWLFVETGYTVRSFPSVIWRGGPLPAGVPRDLNLNGWFVSMGLQFPFQ